MGSNTTAHGAHTAHGARSDRRRRRTAALLLIGALTLAACGGGDDASTSAELSADDVEAADSSGFDAGEGGFIQSNDAELPASEREPDPGGGFDIGVIGRDVIIEMRVVLSSDNVQRTVSSIMAQASALGGGVASSNVNYGTSSDGGGEAYAVLVVKVPPQSVDSLLAGLDDTGTVQSINQSAQDVTEQLINLDVRIDNARQSVANVREFMDRTENLNELVALEGELTRRQTDLEQLEAQQRNLSDRVALSTVTIEVVPTASVPEPIDDDADTIGDAFRKGWDAFSGFVFGIGFILAVLLPFIALAALLGLLGWAIVRRGGHAPTPPVEPRSVPEPGSGEPVDPDADTQAARTTASDVSSDDAELASRPG